MRRVKQKIRVNIPKVSVLVCDRQSLAVAGLRWILNNTKDFRFVDGVQTLTAARELAQASLPSIVLIDYSFGARLVAEWLCDFSMLGLPTAPVIWGRNIGEVEAVQLLRVGARGILPRTAEVADLLECLRTVVAGNPWLSDSLFGETTDRCLAPRPDLPITSQEPTLARFSLPM